MFVNEKLKQFKVELNKKFAKDKEVMKPLSQSKNNKMFFRKKYSSSSSESEMEVTGRESEDVYMQDHANNEDNKYSLDNFYELNKDRDYIKSLKRKRTMKELKDLKKQSNQQVECIIE